MKKFLITVTVMMFAYGAQAQPFIHCSLKKGPTANTVDVLFTPTQASSAGEYITQIQMAISIPAGVSAGVTVTMVSMNNFSTIVFPQLIPYTDAATNERVFSWNYIAIAGSHSWTASEFVGARITFFGNPGASSMVKMLDFSVNGGGGNGNTYFGISTGNWGDATDYGAMFYQNAGLSHLGTYVSGDQYVETDQLVVLPIGLLTFSGYKDGSRNQLNWTTSMEQNNKGFEVQRSLDGVNYSPIGFVNSLANGGNSSVALNYVFTDNNVIGDRQFYRLRQVDLNGNSKLSNIVQIKGDKPTIFTINGMFPNPATTTLNLMVGAPGKDRLTIVVMDMTGKMVMQQSLNVEAGSNTLPIGVSALAGGTYVLKMISSTGEVSTAKFVKQ